MQNKLRPVLLTLGFILLASCTRPNASAPTPPASAPTSGIAFVSERDGNREIYLIQPDGTGLTQLTDHPKVDSDPAWSPDGTQIAFRSRRDGSSDIFIMAADGSSPVNLIDDPADSFDDEFAPEWHPSGSMLAIYTDRFLPPLGNCSGARGVHHLAFMPLDGTGPRIQHFDDLAGEQETLGWAPDGNTIAFSSICNGQHGHIYIWNRTTKDVTQITDGDFNAANPSFSPDGRFLAFSSNKDGLIDVFVMDLATGDIRNITQNEARDRHPAWSPDSTQIAFTSDRDNGDDIFVIDIDGGNARNLTNSPGRDIMPAWSPVP